MANARHGRAADGDARDDETLMEWLASSPSALNDTVLALTSSQTQVGITKPLVFMATLVYNFGPFHMATNKEQERFEQMQLCFAAAASGSTIIGEEQQLLHLSPRMVTDNDSRIKVKRACLGYLEERARSAEAGLLKQHDEAQEQEERRAQKLKEKKRKKKEKKKKRAGASEPEQEKQQDDEECSPATTIDLTSSKEEEAVSPEGSLTESGNAMVSSSPVVDAADSAVESVGSDKENQDGDSLAKGKTLREEETGPAPGIASPPSEVADTNVRTSTSPSVPPPPPPGMSNADSNAGISYLQAASKSNALAAQTIGEELLSDKVQTLEHQVYKQRREHLESQQQVKLKAFIAETQAEAAVERSENLERLLVEALCQIVMERVVDAELKNGIATLAAE